MHLDPALPIAVGVLLLILLISLLLTRLRQPHVVGYLLAGVLLGPHAFGLVTDADVLHRLGSVGVVFLLFFVGMEASPRRLASAWRITVLGTALQVGVTVGLVALIGAAFEWPISRVLLLGFAASLSSTAVILKLLKDWGQLDGPTGQNVLGILLAQDVAIVPMLVVITLLGGDRPPPSQVGIQILGGLLLMGTVVWVSVRETVRLPFARALREDHELQVFAALLICLGLALVAGSMHLSTALGAFVGGIVVGSAKETTWFHQNLEPFRVVFVALFFVSVGMLIDLEFLARYYTQVGLLVLVVLLTNTGINAGILRLLGEPLRESLYAGSLLAQAGEFGFLLAAVGMQAQIISAFGYQLTVAVIAISLALSPPWIRLFGRLTRVGIGTAG